VKRCYEVRGCSASFYLKCPAYEKGKDCWNVTNLPCCKRNNKDRCKDCTVFIEASKDT
jgi:hypothetical protein